MPAAPFDSLVLMVEPKEYTFNEATAADNYFQHRPEDAAATSQKILQEHRAAVDTLRAAGVKVSRLRWAAGEGDNKPDSIFPNNSISLHATAQIAAAKHGASELDAADQSATVVLYPMSKGRRGELPAALLGALNQLKESGAISNLVDLRDSGDAVLEGTGAVNFSIDGETAFVSISQRADEALAASVLGDVFGLKTRHFFDAKDKDGRPVYHTNVVGWTGSRAAAWCLEAMHWRSAEERAAFIEYYASHGIALVELTTAEMYGMAGNALEVRVNGQPKLVMSQTAWTSMSEDKRAKLAELYGAEENIVRVVIPTIEAVGGGSARCLMAECRIPVAVASQIAELTNSA
jgi:hypothetical protein